LRSLLRQLDNKQMHWAIVIFGTIYLVMTFTSIQLKIDEPSLDEYWFMRMSQNLFDGGNPEFYSSDVKYTYEWQELYGTGKEDLIDPNWYYSWPSSYGDPYWVHPPVAYLLAWPIAVTDNYMLGRRIAIMMMLTIVFSMLYLVAKRQPEHALRNVAIAMLPLVLGSAIIIDRLNLFYNDIYMLALLTAALHLRETRYRKWVYLPLSLMVLTKIYAAIFLLPFVMENRKTALCALGLVPYYLGAVVATGDWLFHLHHWQECAYWMGQWTTQDSWLHNIPGPERIGRLVAGLIMVMPFLLASIPILIWALKRHCKFYPALYLAGAFIGLGWGPYYYQMYPWYISSAGMVGQECKRC